VPEGNSGQNVQLPTGFHLHENGIMVTFSQILDRVFCETAKEHFAQCWNYRYSSAYGSSEYSALHYGMRGHDRLRIASAHVMGDGRSLFLELPDLQLCNQLHLQVVTGPNERHDLFATCNALDVPLSGIPNVRSTKKTLAVHPLDIDMGMAVRRLPNPWRKPIKDARAVRIEAGKNLSYSTRMLKAKCGESLALTLANPDVVPHNWALIQPGTLSAVGGEANKLVADPEAVIRQYVPQTSDVICYTDIVEPLEQATVYFKAPSTPGRYPFLCTFPGHWMVMNGEMVVE
jgi:azurin